MIHVVRIIVGWVVIFIALFILTSGDPLGLGYALSCGSIIWHLLSYWVGWLTINGILWLGIQFVQLVFNHNTQLTDVDKQTAAQKNKLRVLSTKLNQELLNEAAPTEHLME